MAKWASTRDAHRLHRRVRRLRRRNSSTIVGGQVDSWFAVASQMDERVKFGSIIDQCSERPHQRLLIFRPVLVLTAFISRCEDMITAVFCLRWWSPQERMQEAIRKVSFHFGHVLVRRYFFLEFANLLSVFLLGFFCQLAGLSVDRLLGEADERKFWASPSN